MSARYVHVQGQEYLVPDGARLDCRVVWPRDEERLRAMWRALGLYEMEDAVA